MFMDGLDEANDSDSALFPSLQETASRQVWRLAGRTRRKVHFTTGANDDAAGPGRPDGPTTRRGGRERNDMTARGSRVLLGRRLGRGSFGCVARNEPEHNRAQQPDTNGCKHYQEP